MSRPTPPQNEYAPTVLSSTLPTITPHQIGTLDLNSCEGLIRQAASFFSRWKKIESGLEAALAAGVHIDWKAYYEAHSDALEKYLFSVAEFYDAKIQSLISDVQCYAHAFERLQHRLERQQSEYAELGAQLRLLGQTTQTQHGHEATDVPRYVPNREPATPEHTESNPTDSNDEDDEFFSQYLSITVESLDFCSTLGRLNDALNAASNTGHIDWPRYFKSHSRLLEAYIVVVEVCQQRKVSELLTQIKFYSSKFVEFRKQIDKNDAQLLEIQRRIDVILSSGDHGNPNRSAADDNPDMDMLQQQMAGLLRSNNARI
ncbi:hypothetical protein EST38_g13505 [Candolleomyces aberdarensis]|uniref:Uncharacterized protein n=1 Tax=Candolleomyces aberdarensis TaxID=2316362 RepID=A0A4Q2D0J4_9AGAR|nr:hypothetical protein EST38_g13505 [Candolleomyces aberdarensis]